jgi:Sap, sulfolipid-1-addressing protein
MQGHAGRDQIGASKERSDVFATIAPLAAATAMSPLPLVVLIVVLLTPGAGPKGLAFVAGWTGALVAVGALTLAAIGSGVRVDESSRLVAGIELSLGASFLVLGAWQWSRRPPSGTPSQVPRWLVFADGCGPVRALALGALLVVANPKNLVLAVAAAGAVAASGSGAIQHVQGLVFYAVLGSLGVGVLLGARLAFGDRANAWLASRRSTLVEHGPGVTIVLLCGLGTLLILRGTTG